MTTNNPTNSPIRSRIVAATVVAALLTGVTGVAVAAAYEDPTESPAIVDADAGGSEEGTDTDGADHARSEGSDSDVDND